MVRVGRLVADEAVADFGSDLWRAYRLSGDESARDRVVVAYAPLARYLAERMHAWLPIRVDDDALISAALAGLVAAVERFEPAGEVGFAAYAVRWIDGWIGDAVRALDLVPGHVRARAEDIMRAMARVEARSGRPATDDDVAAELQIWVDDVRDWLAEFVRTGPPLVLCGGWVDSDVHDPRAARDRVADAVLALPEREKLTLVLHYCTGLTLREIGEVFGLNETHLSQGVGRAILRLTARLGYPPFPTYPSGSPDPDWDAPFGSSGGLAAADTPS
jgi:RNA polymerase sigma factor for flagellar operon FliA